MSHGSHSCWHCLCCLHKKGHSNNKVYTSGLSWLHIHLNLDESPNHMSRNFIIETKHCIPILRVNTKWMIGLKKLLAVKCGDCGIAVSLLTVCRWIVRSRKSEKVAAVLRVLDVVLKKHFFHSEQKKKEIQNWYSDASRINWIRA